jgi:hypothetical protein
MDTHHETHDALPQANHLLPFEIFLLAMLIEKHKEVRRLREGWWKGGESE